MFLIHAFIPSYRVRFAHDLCGLSILIFLLLGGCTSTPPCPAGEQMVEGICLTSTCPSGKIMKLGICEEITCPADSRLVGNVCQKKQCADGEDFFCGKCLSVPQDKAKKIAVVTHFTTNLCNFSSLSVKNHIEYAQRHGYTYLGHEGRISGHQFQDEGASKFVFKEGLYWQKITAVEQTLNTRTGNKYLYDWVLWIDADAIFTNLGIKAEDVIAKYGKNKDLIIPADDSKFGPQFVINNGVFLLRNSAWSRKFIADIAALYPLYKDCPTPEQDAFQDYIHNAVSTSACADNARGDKSSAGDFAPERLKNEVAVIPQRVMDSFHRPLPFFDVDSPNSRWRPCDFVMHLSGIPDTLRIQEMTRVLSEMKSASCPANLPNL